MTEREGACTCRQLRLVCTGAPVRISMCHCRECQRRTGSVFGVQAWFAQAQVRVAQGETRQHVRIGDSGRRVLFNFCPGCGGTVFWHLEGAAELIAVAVGCFADPDFPPPTIAVHERSRHPWTAALGAMEIERRD